MFGNWSKRRKVVKDAENYLKATDVVSRPMAVLMSFAAFVIIGLLLFSVFLGGRWAYHKVKGDDTSSVTAKTTPAGDGPGDSANTENKQQEFPPITSGGANQSGATSPQTAFTTTAPAASTSTESTIVNTGPTVIPDTGPDESQP